MFSVSNDFKNAESSDVNKPIYRVYLVSNNYLLPAKYNDVTFDSSNVSLADWPAAGLVNGDRTGINAGPASGADDDIGLATWKDNNPGDGAGYIKYDISYHLSSLYSRLINRIKISYYDDGTGYVNFAPYSYEIRGGRFHTPNLATNVLAATSNLGESLPVYSFIPNYRFEIIDFPTDLDIWQIQWRQIVSAHPGYGQHASYLNSLELYFKLDVTDKVISFKSDRARDYSLKNPLAAGCEITFDNSDGFFNFNTPVIPPDQYLIPGMEVIVQSGFNTANGLEYVTIFNGWIDDVSMRPADRTVKIQARDRLKFLTNSITSCKLKSSISIENAIKYICQLSNIAEGEIDLDATSMNIDYFFTDNENSLDVIRALVEAAGDALFYIDEYNHAWFKCYLDFVYQSVFISSQSDYLNNYASVVNIDFYSVGGQITPQWSVMENWEDVDWSSNPAWNLLTYSPLAPTYNTVNDTYGVAGRMICNPGLTGMGVIDAGHKLYGTWFFRFKATSYVSGFSAFIISDGTRYSTALMNNSYYVQFSVQNNTITIYKFIGSYTPISSVVSYTFDANWHYVNIQRNSETNIISVYIDGFLRVQSTADNSITSNNGFALVTLASNSGACDMRFDDLMFSTYQTMTAQGSSTLAFYVSNVYDQTATVSEEGLMIVSTANSVVTKVIAYTATSSDGVNFDAYVQIGTNGQILSTMKRYIKFMIELYTAYNTTGTLNDYALPTVFDVTLNWKIKINHSLKYPTTVSKVLRREDMLLDIEQAMSDSLAGDTSIINDVVVESNLMSLQGADTDTMWQGTVNNPPVSVSGSNPYNVVNGTVYRFPISIDGGMDVSRMSGANPAAAVVTFGSSATGSWVFTKINPTRPVLQITITHSGTITDLRLIGKHFESTNQIQSASASDAVSIIMNGKRSVTVNNKYINNVNNSQTIATKIVANFKDPIPYLLNCKIRPCYSLQVGDRVTIIDDSIKLNADYLIAGISHNVSVSLTGSDASTDLNLLKIPG
jgi:hypothetical protein